MEEADRRLAHIKRHKNCIAVRAKRLGHKRLGQY